MANYNYGRYIGEALDAIFGQSYSPLEVIVIDDGSTDNSAEILGEFGKKHPNLIFLRNERNMGALYSINRALSASKGDYVYSAASDDKVLHGFFKKSMETLSQYPQAGLCCADSVLFDGKNYIEDRRYLGDRPVYFSPGETAALFKRDPLSPIIPYTVIVKKECLLEAGGYKSELKWACDLFAHNVVSFRHGFCYIPEVLTLFRQHAEQYGGKVLKKSKLDHEVIRNMIALVRTPPYRDVLPVFRVTAGFSQSPWEVLKVVTNDQSCLEFLSFKLLKYGLIDLIKRQIKLFMFNNMGRKLAAKSRYLKYIAGKIVNI
jgi:glycosyltransferase involved in cell wall biosynthesis